MLSLELCFIFVPHETFKKSLDELMNCCKHNTGMKLSKTLQLSLKKFAYKSAYLKGAIFGFGENTEAETETVLKISSLSNEEINAMDKNKVQVHNIRQERSESFFNHEISIHSKRNVDSASRQMVLNKFHDIRVSSRSFRTLSQPANEIKVLIWD